MEEVNICKFCGELTRVENLKEQEKHSELHIDFYRQMHLKRKQHWSSTTSENWLFLSWHLASSNQQLPLRVKKLEMKKNDVELA